MHREELVGIQTIWWVDYQLAVGFLTGSWKSNMDVWISNQLFANPTAYPYLIFVIFFTLAKFLENKIYTEKRQFFALNL